jgi:nucleoside-diphosphate-sugar epimerase
MRAGHVLNRQHALVTGCAGFIGSHLCERLIDHGYRVTGVDCFTDFYPREAKEANLSGLRGDPSFELVELDLAEEPIEPLLGDVTEIYHLAAQAGVRGSFGATFALYARNNISATQRLLEAATTCESLRALVYASSSSVYGNATVSPTPEQLPPAPVSPYGMTKVATEQLANVYHRRSGLPVVGLRYFTAYGPRQRPDMAFHRFMTRALAGEPIAIYGDGRQLRDFTFVTDVVEATVRAGAHGRPGEVYNVGGGTPAELLDVIGLLEELVGRPIACEHRGRAAGDASHTHADVSRARADFGFVPAISLRDGLVAQLAWMRDPAPRAGTPRPVR